MLPRREAIKTIALSTLSAKLLADSSSNKIAQIDSNAKIVIVGGGTAGITILSHLTKSIKNHNITIIAPNEIHIYQPGQVYVAAGLYQTQDILKETKEYIPDGVEWIKEKVESFLPDENSLLTSTGKKVSYDYLIVATGLEYRYEDIKGLKKEDIGTRGISSVYLNNTDTGEATGGLLTWQWFQDIKEAAKKKKLKLLYTMPHTSVKCGGVAQMIMYLSADYLKKENINAEFIYTPSGARLFGLKAIDEKLHESQKRYDSITNRFHHELIEIDIKTKIAIYKHEYELKKGWDEEFQEWESIEKKSEIVKINYDFIHIVPPMVATSSVAKSKLAKDSGHFKGWLDVDMNSLGHTKYKNVFGLGDICGTPLGKTVPTIERQAKVVKNNLIALITKKELASSFDGYSVCPIKTAYGELVLAAFDYNGVVKKDQGFKNSKKKDWLSDLYVTKPEYWSKTLRGEV
ncbi:NAD(P)/FAD-dependent oxidoreductase [Sulfurimonas aquatica]|nr:FAD/NAD(P)-binding oxidoreductase [Sulfurimonas aquatica]